MSTQTAQTAPAVRFHQRYPVHDVARKTGLSVVLVEGWRTRSWPLLLDALITERVRANCPEYLPVEDAEYAALFAQHHAPLLRYARRWASREVAEDAVSATFERARTIPRGQVHDWGGWLYRTMRHKVADLLRAQRRSVSLTTYRGAYRYGVDGDRAGDAA